VIAIFGVREIPEIELMPGLGRDAGGLRASVGGLKAGVVHNDEINIHGDATVEQSLVQSVAAGPET
jgi:hypothetical protein